MAVGLTVVTLVFGTSTMGRVNKPEYHSSSNNPNETRMNYFTRTKPIKEIVIIDTFLSGFFLLDFLTRLALSSDKILFFSDLMNWSDFFVIISAIVGELPVVKHYDEYETYPIILKIPRLFRIFRLTKNLRIGIDAFVMTLKASSAELLLIGVLTIIAMFFFGVTIYVVELINEISGDPSTFKSIYDGMWWAIGTMATVGYGDMVPHSAYGYVVGVFCIMTGVIISQLPVPIFLKNFALFYSQIEARIQLVNASSTAKVDPDNVQINELEANKIETNLQS